MVKDQSPLLACPSGTGRRFMALCLPSITTVESSGTAVIGSVRAARVCVLSYIFILNVRLDIMCVTHQQVLDIHSWDNGIW